MKHNAKRYGSALVISPQRYQDTTVYDIGRRNSLRRMLLDNKNVPLRSPLVSEA